MRRQIHQVAVETGWGRAEGMELLNSNSLGPSHGGPSGPAREFEREPTPIRGPAPPELRSCTRRSADTLSDREGGFNFCVAIHIGSGH